MHFEVRLHDYAISGNKSSYLNTQLEINQENSGTFSMPFAVSRPMCHNLDTFKRLDCITAILNHNKKCKILEL